MPALFVLLAVFASVVPVRAQATPAAGDHLRVLFLGDRGHHQPAARAQQVLADFRSRGIDLFYSDELGALEADHLRRFDVLLVYANHPRITPRHERALLDWVAAGGGLVAVHCASYCFQNSDAWVALVGAQFERHGTGTFRETIVAPDHPLLRGLTPIESWDETYVHRRHNPDRTVLAVREENGEREPWTWVRTHGDGRVFYTAWGHDERTWSNDGFRTLLERGIRWSKGDAALAATPVPPPFTFREAEVPEYRPGRQGQLHQMQEPLSPAASMRRLVVPPEFEVQLFAADPDIVKPIAMAWDERGRLWLAETVDYPNDLQPEGRGNDRITICEDRDGDGRAETFTRFADGLSLPTSLTFADGGVIVTQPPDTLFLRDTDGDDRADERRVLFTGWSTGDTHAGPSNLRYGFDNWIWGAVGYAGFDGVVGGERHRFRQGFYRFKPDGSQLEFLASTTNNTWGLGFSEDGLVFGSTANGNPSVHLAIPNRYYEAVPGWSPGQLQTIAEHLEFHPVTEHVRQVDFHGQFTAGAGHALYTARAFPRDYWNRVAFVNGPTGHLLHRFVLERDGTGFVARDGWNLVASDDEWTAPIMAEVGPDGAVWFLDWYNYIVQHNPTPRGYRTGRGNAYETPLRDKRHGRVYRVAWRDAAPMPAPQLRAATPAQWVAALRHDNLFWRLHAQRLLVERGERDVVPSLLQLLTDGDTDGAGLAPGALHALWTLHGLGVVDGTHRDVDAAVSAALRHPVAAVRRAAVMVAARNETTREALLDAGLLEDADAQVRLAALLALAELPSSERAGAAIVTFLARPGNVADRRLCEGATAAAARHDAGFLAAALRTLDPGSAAVAPEATTNLLPNASFEEIEGGQPSGWRVRTYGGEATHDVAADAHGGSRSLHIASRRGADSSWFAPVAVEPDTTYRLSAWIKTADVRVSGGAQGALLNVHELQGQTRVQTEPVRGTSDWTRVEVTFDTDSRTRLSINCLFGGWGPARGEAWFDDVRLQRVGGPALPGPVGRIVTTITRHYAARAPVESVVTAVRAASAASPALAQAFLAGLIDGWPDGAVPALSDTDIGAMTEAMTAASASVRLQLAKLVDRWGQRAQFATVVAGVLAERRALLDDAAAEATVRAAAAADLLQLDDSRTPVDAILGAVTLRTDPDTASALLGALEASRRDDAGDAILAHWPQITPAAQTTVLRVLSRRKPWTRALLQAIVDGRVNAAALSAQAWQPLEQHPDADIAALANRARSKRLADDREQVVARMLPAASQAGDAERGRALFTQHCAVCHRLDGNGGGVGPPLDGIGARPRGEILTAILDPNSSVEATYQMWLLVTTGGEVFSGRLDTETRTTVELLDVEGKRHVIERADIETLRASPLSLMPASFEVLGMDGLADLLEYLGRSKK